MNIYKLSIDYDKAGVCGENMYDDGGGVVVKYSVNKFSEELVKKELADIIVHKVADKDAMFTVTQKEISLAGDDGDVYLGALLFDIDEMITLNQCGETMIEDADDPEWKLQCLGELKELLNALRKELPSDKE